MNVKTLHLNIQKAFAKVKKDMQFLSSNFAGLKENVDEWITYLNTERRDMKKRILVLEQRLAEMEHRQAYRLRR